MQGTGKELVNSGENLGVGFLFYLRVILYTQNPVSEYEEAEYQNIVFTCAKDELPFTGASSIDEGTEVLPPKHENPTQDPESGSIRIGVEFVKKIGDSPNDIDLAGLPHDLERCTRLLVQTVGSSYKFHQDLMKTAEKHWNNIMAMCVIGDGTVVGYDNS
jgi:hypothetical protein